MLAEKMENNTIEKCKTCEYKGVTYFVVTDIDTKKDFIEVDGKKLYLDCYGNVANKQRGTKTIKTAIESFEDMKKTQDYFIKNNQWLFYLLFTLNINTGRRISDLRAARWCDFFDNNGNIKEYWDVHKENGERGEQKTGKTKEIYINIAIKEAFKKFLENENIDLKCDYNEHIFKQLHGTHKGKVISEEGYRQALIKAGSVLNYEIRSHSMRRGLGSVLMELHPNDPKVKAVLMEIYNHSSEAMTNKYIGETAKMEKAYISDFGEKYKKYVMDGEEIPFMLKKPVSVYDNAELRDYMLRAFMTILDNAQETDSAKLLEMYNSLLNGLEEIAK